MFNLFKNCHWENVVVKNTDATGFGVDCPMNGSMKNCVAIHCGKGATEQHGGASGFGIGFGYADGESMKIENCQSLNNKKFGFFFEHQGRFNSSKYTAISAHDFTVLNCKASGNLYNFGGIYTRNTAYQNCQSSRARSYGFYFENSAFSRAENCKSEQENDASFAVLQSGEYGVQTIDFQDCQSENCPCGVKAVGENTGKMAGISIQNCIFSSIGTYTVYTEGFIQSLTLKNNFSDCLALDLSAKIEDFVNENNSWNK